MNKYSEIIRRVMDNANITSENSNDRKSIHRDIEDVLNDMFMTTEAPITTSHMVLGKSTSVSEAGTINLATVFTKTIYSMSELVTTLNSSELISSANITIISSLGDEILNEDIELILGAPNIDAFDVSFTDSVGAILTLTQLTDSDTTYSMTWDEVDTSIDLSSDIFIPFEAIFKISKDSRGSFYKSKEMLEEEFMRWNPAGSVELDESTTSSELVADVISSNLENLEFDGKIGYYFEMTESVLRLHYKPAIKGVVAIRHSYFPTVSVVEANVIPVHKAFANCLVYGTTIKQLEKQLMKVSDEISLVKVKSAISVYRPKYLSSLSDYAGFNRRKTQTHVIKMFDFLSDDSMNVL